MNELIINANCSIEGVGITLLLNYHCRGWYLIVMFQICRHLTFSATGRSVVKLLKIAAGLGAIYYMRGVINELSVGVALFSMGSGACYFILL